MIIPKLGGEQTLICCAAANLALGAAMLVFLSSAGKMLKGAAALAALSIVVFAAEQPTNLGSAHTYGRTKDTQRTELFSSKEILPYSQWKDGVDKSFEEYSPGKTALRQRRCSQIQ